MQQQVFLAVLSSVFFPITVSHGLQLKLYLFVVPNHFQYNSVCNQHRVTQNHPIQKALILMKPMIPTSLALP